jgi:hypothetical protein
MKAETSESMPDEFLGPRVSNFASADVETALAISRENLRLVENHRPAQATLCK